MLLALVSSFFCILNIVLWIFFLSRYKHFFSTDEILESTREELDRMIADVNRNAGRNIDIIEDRIKQLRAVVAEADRHLAFAQAELEKQKNLAVFQQKIDTASSPRSGGNYKQSVAVKYKKNANLSHSNVHYDMASDDGRYVPQTQTEFFDQMPQNLRAGEIVSDSGTVFSVEKENSQLKNASAAGPDVIYSDSPIEQKKSFRELVHDLNLVGHSVEEIAMELNRSTTEVQMVLDMDF